MRLAEETFDLALVDLDLPDLPGRELIVQLRERQPQMALAVLTAHLIADDAATRAELGVDAVLGKPVSPRALSELLSGLAAPVQAVDLRAEIDQIGAETVGAMVAAFLEDLPAALEAITAQDGPQRAKAAHRLKGAASNFGLAPLCDLLAGIEAEPQTLNPATLRAQADEAVRALNAAARAAGLQDGSEVKSR